MKSNQFLTDRDWEDQCLLKSFSRKGVSWIKCKFRLVEVTKDDSNWSDFGELWNGTYEDRVLSWFWLEERIVGAIVVTDFNIDVTVTNSDLRESCALWEPVELILRRDGEGNFFAVINASTDSLLLKSIQNWRADKDVSNHWSMNEDVLSWVIADTLE